MILDFFQKFYEEYDIKHINIGKFEDSDHAPPLEGYLGVAFSCFYSSRSGASHLELATPITWYLHAKVEYFILSFTKFWLKCFDIDEEVL